MIETILRLCQLTEKLTKLSENTFNVAYLHDLNLAKMCTCTASYCGQDLKIEYLIHSYGLIKHLYLYCEQQNILPFNLRIISWFFSNEHHGDRSVHTLDSP